jgi:two-component system, NarL family, sensor histidine kinase UhpB
LIALTAMVIAALSSVIEQLQTGVAQAVDLEARLRDEAAARLEVAQRLLSHEEALRGNLARELHDDIGQRLTAIKITLETARVRRQDTLATASREATRLMRELSRDMSVSANLRPTLIDQGGISRAIRTLARDETARAGLTADVDVPDGLPIRNDAQIPCYRIVQEALTNSIRHARARSIIVRGARVPNGVLLIVHDDGVGFDVEAARRLGRAGERLGLVGMRERAEGIGAHLDIVSSSGRGTKVRLVVPHERVA